MSVRLALRLYFVPLFLIVFVYTSINYFYKDIDQKKDFSLVVYKGDSRQSVAQRLVSQGVLSYDWFFRLVWRIRAPRAKLQSGALILHPPFRRMDILNALVSGHFKPHKVMIPEGLTSHQIVQRLQEDPFLTGDMTVPPEGTLLPDTYAVPYGESRQRLLDRMKQAMNETLTRLWSRHHGHPFLKTPWDVLVLASILEKETGRTDEHRRIAGILIRRMQKGMKLQSDPTTIYGLSQQTGIWAEPLKYHHLKDPSPWNTYQIYGLPPTPICNPGIRALEAAFQPLSTQDLYFVADGEGGHLFGRTFEHHKKNRDTVRSRKKQP